MTTVEQARPGQEAAWDEFVSSQPGGIVYYSSGYGYLLCAHLGADAEYLMAVDGGEIRGVLPILRANRVMNALPFYGSHGAPLAATPQAERSLIDAWNERATDPGTLAATMVSNPFARPPRAKPVHNLTDSRISQMTPLSADVLASVDSSARRNARKAERLGIEVDRDPSAMPDLARIHADNMSEIGGRPKALAFFEAVPRYLEGSFDVWVARLEGEVVAALLTLRFGSVVEYFTPVVEHEHRGDQPLAAILATALQQAAADGYERWNWGGTWATQDGVHRFKSKWGAGDTEYDYWVQLNDETLLERSPADLRADFGDFYVVPFSALRGEGVPR